MGFIKAFSGAIGGTLADQWKDYIAPMSNLPATVGLLPGIKVGQNNNRGENTKGSNNIISNGSKILVPEGFGLITMQDGAITGYITEPGGYTFESNDPNSRSIFAGDGFINSLVKQSWERFKFGGIPGSNQTFIYVNLKEIPNNKFGTQSEIYWDDSYLNAQVGALTRGTYSLKIVDPISFIKNFVPINTISNNGYFDFADMDNDASAQLFNEVVSSLSSAFSIYTNDPARQNRITKIQSDAIGFAKSLSEAVEKAFNWISQRGIQIVSAAVAAIEYDEDTKKLLSDVKKADALSGNRGNSFMQQSLARGFENAGKSGSDGMAFMAMGVNSVGSTNSLFQNTNNQNMNNQNQEDPMEKLMKLKNMLDQGLISQQDYDDAKKKILGI